MKNKLEAVSDLIDGDESQLSKAIDTLLSDEEARSLWGASYDFKHVMSEPKAVIASASFALSISEKIEQEPSLLIHSNVEIKPSESAKVFRLLKPIAGLSIAATVAAIAVFGVGGYAPNNSTLGVSVANHSSPQVASTGPNSPNLSIVPVTFTGEYDHRTYWEGSNKATSKELNRYLSTHLEHANPGGFQSVMPYVRVVGYDDE